MLLVAVPRQGSSFRLLTLSCRYGMLCGSNCNNNTLRDVIGVKKGDTVGIVAIYTMIGDARRQAMPMRTQLLRVEVDPGFFRLPLCGVLSRRRLRSGER